MGEVTLELISRQMQAGHDELKHELAALRAEVVEIKGTVQSLARSSAAMQRDITALKDRVVILTAAIDENPPAHV